VRTDWKEDRHASKWKSCFYWGLLSVMDALLNMRMSDVLAEIPVGGNQEGTAGIS